MSVSDRDLAPWAPRTKLARPQAAPEAVFAPGLVERVAELVSSHPVTAVLAGAGSGKTTLAAAVAATFDPVGWVRVDDLDDDPMTVLELVVLAFQDALPSACRSAQRILTGGGESGLDPRRAAAVLVNDLIDAEAAALIVIDDIHTLTRPESLAVLDYLFDNLPDTIHILLTARANPGLALARLRSRGRLAEVGPDDLRLSTDQAIEVLNDRLGLGLDPMDVGPMVERCAGWVTGVRLLGRSPDALDEFLHHELVGGEPDDVQRFLYDTAVLDTVDATTAGAMTGRPDAGSVLADLARRHSLLVLKPDRDQSEFRYHDLLRSFLLRRMEIHDPARLAMLHQAAAGVVPSPAHRIEHLLAAGAWADAADLVDELADPFASWSELMKIEAWAERMTLSGPRPLRTTLALASVASRRGDYSTVCELLEPVFDADESRLATVERWISVRLLHLATNDHARFVPVLAELENSPLFSTLPPQARTDHHLSSAYGAMFTGRWDESAERTRLAISMATSTGDVGAAEALALHLSPLLAAGPGVLEMIAGYASWTAESLAARSPLIALGVHHQRFFVALLRADPATAVSEARSARALTGRVGGSPYLENSIDWVFATAALIDDDLATASQVLVESVTSGQGTTLGRGLLAAKQSLLARVLRRQGRLAELADLAAQAKVDDLNTAKKLTPHWSASMTEAQWRWASGDLEGAASVLAAAYPHEDHHRVAPFLVSPRLDHALVLDAMGRHDEANAALDACVAHAQAIPAPGLLLLAGREVLPLLDRHRSPVAEAARLALAKESRPAPRPVPGTPTVLTTREVEVLHLLDAGASNREIAEALFLSANTVKTHISNVMSKLGARSRGEAVALARQHHIL